MCEFYDEYIEIEEDFLGLPVYRDGFFVLETPEGEYLVFRYSYQRTAGKRGLKVELVSKKKNKEEVNKKKLIQKMDEPLSPPELPLFRARPGIEMPIKETMFPLVKRRLMRIIEDRGTDVSSL